MFSRNNRFSLRISSRMFSTHAINPVSRTGGSFGGEVGGGDGVSGIARGIMICLGDRRGGEGADPERGERRVGEEGSVMALNY
jgi:hypothetical protein